MSLLLRMGDTARHPASYATDVLRIGFTELTTEYGFLRPDHE